LRFLELLLEDIALSGNAQELLLELVDLFVLDNGNILRACVLKMGQVCLKLLDLVVLGLDL